MVGTTRTPRDDENKHYSRALRPGHSRQGWQFKFWDNLSPASPVARLGCSSKSDRGGALCELSEPVASRLSRSVVSIASFIGHTMLVECSGLCIETSCVNATSFLTSASLLPRTAEGKISDNVTIKVRLPDNQIVTGQIQHDHEHFDYAVVKIEHVRGFHATHLDHDIQFEPYRKVVAVWRRFDSGLLTATSGVELGSPAAEPCKTMLSTCEIDTAGIGGPLVDFDGNFVGMNCHPSERKMTPFRKRVLILQLLSNYGIVSIGIKKKIDGTREGSTSEIQKSPTPDIFNDDIWSTLCEGVASRISRSVVALASFDGDETFFSCTGFVTYCNTYSADILTSASLVRVAGDVQKINTNLRIEVCLRNGFQVIGILKAYNLMFNLACIEIMGHWDLRALELHPKSMQERKGEKEPQPKSFVGPDMDVIAVGCLFGGTIIMATAGVKLMNCQSKLDCSELHVSSCKFTQAGVGGPLIDGDGNLLGMNFYHQEEAPFLPTYYLCSFLRSMGLGECFQQDKCRHDFSPLCNKAYSWPLPKPCSYHWPLREFKHTPVRYRVVDAFLAKKGFSLPK